MDASASEFTEPKAESQHFSKEVPLFCRRALMRRNRNLRATYQVYLRRFTNSKGNHPYQGGHHRFIDRQSLGLKQAQARPKAQGLLP